MTYHEEVLVHLRSSFLMGDEGNSRAFYSDFTFLANGFTRHLASIKGAFAKKIIHMILPNAKTIIRHREDTQHHVCPLY